MSDFDYRSLLSHAARRSMRLSEFVEGFMETPLDYLHTSSTLLSAAIQHFGFEIVVRSGEPAVSYNIFKDPFANGTNAVFGQEFCIKQIVNVIEAVGKESGPNRGIVLVGPPASGKTNIVDLISLALEEYTKQRDQKLYSFYFRFRGEGEQIVDIRPPFRHNPILLFPTSLQRDHAISHPRRELFDHVNCTRGRDRIVFPTYYQNATLDKQCLDVIEALMENPRNAGKSLFEILEEYVEIEEISFSNAQAKGIANIDEMRQLRVSTQPVQLGKARQAVLDEHLPGARLYEYQGALVAANRGLLHIHDALGPGQGGGLSDHDGKPLLMLLGSGKASIESTQTSVDTTVILTTNIEELALLERELTASKLLDRIDKIPVNYLLDATSEMDILRRDLANMRERYDVDPNLLRIASYFAVLTRLLPPMEISFPPEWATEKKNLYLSITPEQKLFIYSAQPDDPVATIRKLPPWHPFRSEMIKLGVDVHEPGALSGKIVRNGDRVPLEQTGVFSTEQLRLIDDEFMRELWGEHYPKEGRTGISVRQLQNIMRDTIAHSDGFRVHVGTFLNQLKEVFAGGAALHPWLGVEPPFRGKRPPVPERRVGSISLAAGEGDYGDFQGLAKVVRAIYFDIVRREITLATVNRDPAEIAADLRRYLQHALLAKAHENRAFAHIMVPRYTFIDPATGAKVDRPDEEFLRSIERILSPEGDAVAFRRDVAQRFLDLQGSGELVLEADRPIVASRHDNVLACFGREYARLLSHRRTMGEIDADELVDALFQRHRSPEKYAAFRPELREFVEDLLRNLQERFGYSPESAQETVLFAVRKEIVDFSQIIS